MLRESTDHLKLVATDFSAPERRPSYSASSHLALLLNEVRQVGCTQHIKSQIKCNSNLDLVSPPRLIKVTTRVANIPPRYYHCLIVRYFSIIQAPKPKTSLIGLFIMHSGPQYTSVRPKTWVASFSRIFFGQKPTRHLPFGALYRHNYLKAVKKHGRQT